MRRMHLTLMIVGLFVIASCGADDDRLVVQQGNHSHDDGAAGAGGTHAAHGGHGHGEVHDFNFAADRGGDRADFEAGADLGTTVIEPQAPFRGVKVMVTATKLDLEYRVIYLDDEPGPWQRLTPEQSHSRFHSGFVALYRHAAKLEFRSTSPMDYVRFEFFDEMVDTADSHDDEGMQADARGQALAHPGRYTPPADVREAGLAQQGNFGYERAPAWNGGANCSGTFLPGAAALGEFLVANFDGAAYFQGYNCRQVRGSSSMSMHGTGRAIDVFVPIDSSQPYNNQADNDLGDEIANYLIENATELGIQYFIWDQSSWSISRGVTRSYTGKHPHHDHLHIELTSEAAGADRDDHPGAYNPHFADDDHSPHEEAINAIYDEGITRGCGDDPDPLFCPDDTETRANVAVLLMRAFNLPRSGGDFFDDDDGMNAEPAINALATTEVNTRCVMGDERRFCPDEHVTRGQFAEWVDAMVNLEETDQDYFVDDSGSTYEAAANRLAAAGITNGCSQDRFCGGDLITRAQIAGMLACAVGALDCDAASEPARPVEIVVEWSDAQLDLDLIMHSPDQVAYNNDSPTAQGWLHSGDACPEEFDKAGCTDTLVDGAFSESIWLTTHGAFDGDVPAATLSPGDRGDEVEALQAALNHAGFDVGPVDGIYGGMTSGGVEELQAAHGLDVTGVYDEAAARALDETLTPGDDYTVDVKTFGQEASSGTFDLRVLRDGDEVQSFTGQAAAELGESQTFEFSLR